MTPVADAARTLLARINLLRTAASERSARAQALAAKTSVLVEATESLIASSKVMLARSRTGV